MNGAALIALKRVCQEGASLSHHSAHYFKSIKHQASNIKMVAVSVLDARIGNVMKYREGCLLGYTVKTDSFLMRKTIVENFKVTFSDGKVILVGETKDVDEYFGRYPKIWGVLQELISAHSATETTSTSAFPIPDG
jgi:hypothetical protein